MIVQAPTGMSKRSLETFAKNAKFTKSYVSSGGHEVWSNKRGERLLVPAAQGQQQSVKAVLAEAGYKANARTYLDPSGWFVFDLGPKLGFAVVSPYHAGTLVTFSRTSSSNYPLMLMRWRSLRTSTEIQRYKTRTGAEKAMHAFFNKPCKVGGMVCPLTGVRGK